VKAEKLFAPEPEDVVCAGCVVFGWVDMDGLLHASKIAGPDHSIAAVDDEVEAGIAERVSCRGD